MQIDMTVVQKTTIDSTPFLVLLGLSPYRIIPVGADPTQTVLTFEEFRIVMSTLVERGQVPADEAQVLNDEAEAMLPLDFEAVIAQLQELEVDAELGDITFQACSCGEEAFIMHGQLLDGDTPISRKVHDIKEAFQTVNSLTAGGEPVLSPEQAVLAFRELVESGIPMSYAVAMTELQEDPERSAAYEELFGVPPGGSPLGFLDALFGNGAAPGGVQQIGDGVFAIRIRPGDELGDPFGDVSSAAEVEQNPLGMFAQIRERFGGKRN